MTPEDIRHALTENARLRAHTSAVIGKIDQAGEDRLQVIAQRLDELKPKTITDPEAAQEYQDLVLERGRILAM
jgi:DNA-binding IclR family transcriptional regulator